MIWISDCRYCPQPQWYYRQVRSKPAPGPVPAPGPTPTPGPVPPPPPREPRADASPQAPPPPKQRDGRSPAPCRGVFGGLGRLLPEGMDSGDIFLAALLLFLYSESHDEDFLIILAVVALSIFRHDGK